MIRFVHTVDLQLGKPFAGFKGDAGAQLRELRFTVIDRIAQTVKEHGADFVLIAGDLFDANTVEDRVIGQACERLRQIDVPILVIPGNHDHGGTPDSVFRRRLFLDSQPPNLMVLEEARPHALPDLNTVSRLRETQSEAGASPKYNRSHRRLRHRTCADAKHSWASIEQLLSGTRVVLLLAGGFSSPWQKSERRVFNPGHGVVKAGSLGLRSLLPRTVSVAAPVLLCARELLERRFGHYLDDGGMRRMHLRRHENVVKRLLVHVSRGGPLVSACAD